MKDLHCLISEETYEKLREVAFKDRVSLAELIRKAVEEYLKGRGMKVEFCAMEKVVEAAQILITKFYESSAEPDMLYYEMLEQELKTLQQIRDEAKNKKE